MSFNPLSVLTGTVTQELKESENDKPDIQIDSEANLVHTPSSNAADVSCTLNVDSGKTTEDGQKSDFEVNDGPKPEINKETFPQEVPVSHENSQYVTSSRNEIYAVDMEGHCLPVDFAWASHNSNHCNHTLFGNSKTHDHSSKSSSTNDSRPFSDQRKTGEKKYDQSGGQRSSFHATAQSQATTGPFSVSMSVADVGGGGLPFGTMFTYVAPSSNQTENGFKQFNSQTPFSYTTQTSSPNQTPFGSSFNCKMTSSANKTHTGFEQCRNQAPFANTASSTGLPQFGTSFNHETTFSTNRTQNDFKQRGSPTSSPDSTRTSTANQRHDPIGTAVHILPETLVNGAISVASQAYTTARAVLSNLRGRPSEVNI
jgi:hypothetical protein